MNRLLAAATLAAVTIGVAACGGSSHKSSTSTSTTKTKTKITTAPTTRVKLPTAIALEIRPAKKGAAFSTSLKVAAGEQIQLRAVLPPSIGTKTTKVEMNLAVGPGKSLTATAKALGHSTSVAVDSATGKPVTLELLHFSCSLPPAPTICPPVREGTNRLGVHVRFAATRSTPIFLSGTVGPVATKPTPPPSSGSVVPPYTVTEGVRAVVPGATATSSTFSTSATANPGELVVIATRLKAGLRGAPQPVTIKLQQGPGTALTASASVPGGQPSRVTIKSSSSSPIALVLPHYSCFIPPAPTFCPASKTSAGSHQYTLQFSASPGTPAIIIQAMAQAG